MNNKKYGSYADKKKRSAALKVGAIILGTTISVVGIYQFVILDYYGNKVRENTIEELTNKESGFVKTYRLTKDITEGTKFEDETLLEEITQNSSVVPETCIKNKSDVKDLVSRIELKKNTIVTYDMLIDMEEQITDEIKNSDFNWIRIHTFLQQGDYVDIHYKEMDGTDTIVASKKKVTNLSGNTFSTNISELERAFINNATVRADVTGGELYLSIYPEPENQNAAEVTYVLDNTIQQAIEKDPNIVIKSADRLKEKIDSTVTEKPNFARENKIKV